MIERRVSAGSRIVSMLLVLCMVVGMLPATVFPVFAADTTTADNVAAIRAYAENLLNSNFSKAASEDSTSNSDKFTWDTEGKKTNWRYYNGVMLDALLMLGVDSTAGNALEFAKDFMDTNTENAEKAVTHYIANEVDSVPPALVLFDLLDTAEVTDSDRAIYAQAINYVFGQLENQYTYADCGGNYLHKQNSFADDPTDSWSAYEIGLDGIYMAEPFLMEYANALAAGKITNTVNDKTASDIYKEVYDRLMWVADKMYDSNTGLYHHGWSVDNSKGNGHFWSRGIGWYAAGLVMCIDLMPEGSYKTDLIGNLGKLFDGMLQYQHTSGLWYNVVNRDSTLTDNNGNQLEASGTALMAYAMMKAYNEGWVTASKYATAAEKGFNGIVSAMEDGKIVNIYKSSGVCTDDASYCKNSYVSDEAKGVGPVLMAASEISKYAGVEEVFNTGVVVAPEMAIAKDAASLPTTNGIKVTLVSNHGTIANVDAAQMTYVIGDTSGSTATVTVKNGDYTIDTFEVTVIDTSATNTVTGSFYVEEAVTDTPSAPAVTTNGWVLISSGSGGNGKEYTVVTTPAEGQNYLIAQSGNKYTLNWTGSAWDAGEISGYNSATDGVYTISGTICHWQWDDAGYFYTTVDSKDYYIYYTGTSSSNVSATTDSKTATVFTVTKSTDSIVHISGVVSGKTRYLQVASKAAQHNSSAKDITLFQQVQSGTAEYAMLSGTATYAYAVGTSTDIVAQIKSDYVVQSATDSNGTDAADVSWDDVTITWDKTLDVSTAGTYTATVTYGDKTLGTIPVLIYGDTVEVEYKVNLTVPASYVVAYQGGSQYVATMNISSYVTNGSGEMVNASFTVNKTTDNASVATVDSNGNVSALSAGTANIVCSVDTVTYNNTEYAVSASASTLVVVNDATTPTVTYEMTGIVVAPVVEVGQTAQAVGYTQASNGVDYTYTYQWSVDDYNVATIDSTTGVLTAKAAGTVTVTGKAIMAGENWITTTAKTATVTIVEASEEEPEETTEATTEPEETTYSYEFFNVSNTTIEVGGTVAPTFSVSVDGEDISDQFTMTLTSGNESVAKIENNTVVGVAAGTATITMTVAKNAATFAVDSTGDTYSTTFTVTVEAATTDDDTTYTYVLDTDGIDSGEEYIIVDYLSDVPYAMGHSGTEEKTYSVTVIGDTVTIGESDLQTALWKITESSTSGMYSVVNGTTYLKTGGSTVFSTDTSKTVSITSNGDGTYFVELGSSQGLSVKAESDWIRDGSDDYVYLYKKTEAVAEQEPQAVITVEKLWVATTDAKEPVATVTYDGAAVDSYVVTYTMADNSYVTLSDGKFTGVAPGYYTATATLTSVTVGDNTYEVDASCTFQVQTIPWWTNEQTESVTVEAGQKVTFTYSGDMPGVAKGSGYVDDVALVKDNGDGTTTTIWSTNFDSGTDGWVFANGFGDIQGSKTYGTQTLVYKSLRLYRSSGQAYEDLSASYSVLITEAGTYYFTYNQLIEDANGIGTMDGSISVVTATGELSITSVTVTKANGAEDPTTVDSSLLENLVMTVTYSDGTTEEIGYSDLTISDIKYLEEWGNYLDVDYYVDGVRVVHSYILVTIEEEPAAATGSYVLYTGGAAAGEYIIVYKYSDKYYAYKNNSGSATAVEVTPSADMKTLELADGEDGTYYLFTFELTGDSDKYGNIGYTFENNGYYIKKDASLTSSKPSDEMSLVDSSASDGIYQIVLAEDSSGKQNLYMSSATKWTRGSSGGGQTVYLYVLNTTPAVTYTATVTLDSEGEDLYVGNGWQLNATVVITDSEGNTVEGATPVITWSSGDSNVTVTDGYVYAAGVASGAVITATVSSFTDSSGNTVNLSSAVSASATFNATLKTVTTEPVTANAGDVVTLDLAGTIPAGSWGWLDNVKVYKDGVLVDTITFDDTTGWTFTNFAVKNETGDNALRIWLSSDEDKDGSASYSLYSADGGVYYFTYELIGNTTVTNDDTITETLSTAAATLTYTFNTPDGTPITGYTTYDLEVGKTWTPSLTVTANGIDVSSEYYITVDSSNDTAASENGDTITGLLPNNTTTVNISIYRNDGTLVKTEYSVCALSIIAEEHDIDCSAGFIAEYKDYTLTEAVQTWTFDVEALANSSGEYANWYNALVQIITGSTYDATIRADAFAWTGTSLENVLAFYSASGVPTTSEEWAAWLETCKAGTTGTVTAQLVDGNAVVAIEINGARSTYIVPLAEGETHTLRLSGEYVYLDNITESTSHIDISDAVSSLTSTGSVYIHNFTEHDKTSEFYTISGNLSTGEGSVSYNGETLTQCLKIESSTSIKFTAANAGTLTLVFNSAAAGKQIKINGVSYDIGDDGILTIDLEAGDYEITKDDSVYLFYMAYAEEGSSGSGSGSTTTVSYELFTGTGADIADGDIFLIVSSDQTVALKNDSDGNSSQIAALSAAVTVNGNYAIIGSSDEAYATWTIGSWKATTKDAGTYYSFTLGNGKRFIGDSSSEILKSSGKTLYLFPTDTAGKYMLAGKATTSDGAIVPDGNYWYYDTESNTWLRSETVGYVYLYKQTTFTAGVTVEQPGTLYIGASGTMPTVQLQETVMHGGAQLTTGEYSITWSIVSGSEHITLDTETGLVTAVVGGSATVRATVTVGEGDSAVTYYKDVVVTVANPSITVTEEISLISGATEELGKEQIAVTVSANNAKTEDYTVTYTSSDHSVATVDAYGNVTAVGEGTAIINATLTAVNGLNVSALGVTASTNVTVTAKEISAANLNTYDYIVHVDADADALNAALSHMVLTVDYNTGDQIVAQYGTDPNLEIDLTGVITATAGIQYATVTYTDADGNEIFRDTIWIHVEDFDLDQYDGIVIEEMNVTYILDTDGVDVNQEYVIVANGYAIALLNPSVTSTDCSAATTAAVTIDGTTLTIGASDAPLAAWLFDTPVTTTVGGNTVYQYNASNFLRYLGIDDNMMLVHHNVEHVYVTHLGDGKYQIVLSYTRNGSPAYYLTYNGSSWVATTTASYVYLYHKIATYQDYTLNFELAPTAATIPEGFVTTIVPTVKYNQDTVILDESRYEIIWSSSNESVAIVDQNGNVTAVSVGTAEITAKLVSVDGFEVEDIETELPYIIETATIEVIDANPTAVLTPSILTIGVGSTPNLAKVTVKMTYGADASEYDYYIPYEMLTFHLADATGVLEDGSEVTGFSSAKPGKFTVEITYAGQSFNLTIVVDEDPYAGLDAADSIPGYPDAGAVRMEKTATGVIDFNSTGVVQLELTAAGISTKSSVDVVLIVDVSNSMAWSMDWFDGLSDSELESANDQTKIPTVNDDYTVNGTTKLDMAMESARDFADILLNVEGGDNTLSFVTFAGNDADHGGESGNLDSVRTPFVGVTDYNTAKSVFDATKFSYLVKNSNGSSVAYYLDIGGSTANGYGDEAVTSGFSYTTDDDGDVTFSGKSNRGNTNYDYAFGEATKAIAALKAQYAANNNGASYDESGRQLYVVFMTDGAPSQYNGYYLSGRDTDTMYANTADGGNEEGVKYTKSGYSQSEWLTHINDYHNLATALEEEIYAYYTVGFDLAHGGFGDYSWEESEMERVLAGMVKNSVVPVTMATDETELNNFYTNLAKALAYAGTSAKVTDQIGDNFSLFTGTHMYAENIAELTRNSDHELTTETLTQMGAMDFDVEILSYRLVLASDIGDELEVIDTDGTVKTVTVDETHLGLRVNEDPRVEETISFVYDKETKTTYAYSSLLDEDENILTVAADGTVTINAVYFTYVSTPATDDEGNAYSSENIVWKIGNITDREIAMSYYAYLEGALDGKALDEGMYQTNEFAYLEYIDVYGDYVKRDYGVPQAAWGKAGVTVRFYLVNKDGEFVNRAGVTFTNAANRIFLSERTNYETDLNNFADDKEKLLIEALDALTAAGLGSYELYDPTLILQVLTDYATKQQGGVTITKYSKANIASLVFINDVMNDGSYVNTIIDIPVVLTNLGSSTQPLTDKTVVMDYGKPIEIDPFNEVEALYASGYAAPDATTGETFWYTMQIVGFANYSANQDMYAYIPETSISKTLTTANGSYVLGAADENNLVETVVFTPSGFLENVEQVFVAVRFDKYEYANGGKGDATNDYYYMYKLVNVIPASVMYYETEGNTAGEITTTGTWNTTGSAQSGNQDMYKDNAAYGYDSTYTDDSTLSNGSGLLAAGAGVDNTTATFTFTGTGFEIISRTGKDQATIRVQVMDANGEVVKKVTVINKGANELYQIPVVAVSGLEFGTYTVVVGVYQGYTPSADLGLSEEVIAQVTRGNEFYLDAIRIYDPIATTEVVTAEGTNSDGSTKAAVTVADLYKADGEYASEITQVGQLIVDLSDYQNIAGTSDSVSGAVFMDAFSLAESDAEYTMVSDYDNFGPNNEVYLGKGQGIAFTLNVGETIPASLQIGAKSVTGSAATLNVKVIHTADGNSSTSLVQTITSATEMYYVAASGGTLESIFGTNGKVYVVIWNDSDYVLSLTNVKIGYSETPDVPADYTYSSALVDAAYSDLAATNCSLKKVDDVWYYCDAAGEVVTGYTGLVATESVGTWLVVNGQIDFTYSGLYTAGGNTYYISGGCVDTKLNGIVKRAGQWLYFAAGMVDTSFEGLVEYNGTWYVRNGGIDFNYTGLYTDTDDNTTYYIRYGQLATTFSGLINCGSGVWKYVDNGVLSESYTGLAKNATGWWYVNEGTVDTTYSGLAENDTGTWYVKYGQVQTGYSGTVTIAGVTYTIQYGQVVTDSVS